MGTSRSDHATILRDNIPILDVRAPIEFERGHLPNSVNLPILTNDERSQVGIAYKQHGNAAAVKLGYRLVDNVAQRERTSNWSNFVNDHPTSLVTCWRGGQRSKLAQDWLSSAGVDVPRVEGGFKAMRQCSIDVLTQVANRTWMVLAGSTGVGKTQLLSKYREVVDLEGVARHRGSAFGQLASPQPTPVTFEIELAQKLLQTESFPTCLIEDESRTIGRLAVPNPLYAAMQNSKIVVLDASFESRVKLTYDEYVRNAESSQLTSALERIQKRLGATRFATVKAQMRRALDSDERTHHYEWIACLYEWYYDPMYEYQLKRKQERVVFRGDRQAVCEYLAEEIRLQPID